jgi:uncharacterized protein (DUF433 family)
MNSTTTFADHFWSCVDQGIDDSGCWTWQGRVDKDGYGRVWQGPRRGGRRGGRVLGAHRAAWELTYGPIPTGLCVCHHCDNRPCCRPDHLFVGTVADNNRDMAAKGRANNGQTKLTATDVLAILERVAAGQPQLDLAVEYQIGTSAISGIVRGRSWRSLTGGVRRSAPPRPGGLNGQGKLSPVSVQAILDQVAAGDSQRTIAARYGISRSVVSDIVCGRSWQRLTGRRQPSKARTETSSDRRNT